MKRKILFKSVKTRQTFWFLLVSLLPLLIASIIISVRQSEAIKTEAFSKLTAIRDFKVDQVNSWFDERIGDIHTIKDNYDIRALEVFLNKQQWPQENDRLRKAMEFLIHYKKNYIHYNELFIINPLNGIIEVASHKSIIGEDKSHNLYFTQPFKTKRLYIKDIYYSKSMNRTSMTFSIPIFGITKKKSIVGILVARVDLEHSIYNLLQKRTGMGKTGETLIVNKDVVALNELKWYELAPLNLKIHAKPAVLASQGKTGIVETTDYRNESVLAAYTYIPITQWGFVAKMDLKEIYAPVPLMYRHILILLVISAIIVYFLSISLSKKIAQPIIKMSETAKKIQEGDLKARNHIQIEDELGFLAKAFNNMADSVALQLAIQQKAGSIIERIVVAREVETFRKAILKEILDMTGSSMGAYYVHNQENNMFEHFTSIGLIPELLEPFSASKLEGEFGNVLSSKKMVHIKDLPEDTIFKFKTFAGTLIPKEIITLPVIDNKKVSSIISIASLIKYTKEHLEILKQIRIPINTAISNLNANEETKTLAKILKNKNTELTAQAGEMQAQTEELKEQSEELQQQNMDLEIQQRRVLEADRLKSEFLSNMSHELRTPLNSIMALSRVLIMQAKEKLSEEEGNYLEIIERNGKNLLALINDILDLSKIEAGRMDMTPKTFSLGSAIETILESLEPIAAEKDIKLKKDIQEEFPHIESDESRIHQILQNLMGNAVKFTDKGHITVKAWNDSQKIYISVTDTGIGISKENLSHIFEEFRQVDGSTARRFEGTGLGLAIAYKASKMLGGGISVQSVPGKGSIFTLTLPIKWQGVVYAPETPALNTAPELSTGQKTILVVDDEPAVASMISDYLVSEGYHTITATSGFEALRMAQSHHPFAITLDILMPDMDGWEVMQHLKNTPGTKEIPVIIISVSDDRKTGFALGAVGYITKPVNRETLINEIYRIMKQAPQSVMIVDDNRLELKKMAKIVEAEGMATIIVENSATCIPLMEEKLPDVLVLDLMMPEMDGFEVLDRVRSNQKTTDLPVIIVTAKDLTEEDRNRLSKNVSAVITKNETTPSDLLKEIKKILIQIDDGHEKTADKASEFSSKILLVEDNEATIIQVRKILENQGYSVDVARGGQDAIDYVSHTVPDGIILDLMMPEIDGFEVLEMIRRTEATANISVLILTAKDLTKKDLSRLSANNIQQLIQKGDIDQEGLLLKIRMMLGSDSKSGPKLDTQVTDQLGKTIQMQDEGKTPLMKIINKTDASEKPKESGNTILVVEDNPDNMTTIKAVLTGTGKYNILEATDGEEGLKKALTERPDLVLLDMALPKMDGLTVVQRVKTDPEAKNIPIIALTAQAMKGDRDKILKAGCDDYISKPIDPENMQKKVKEWLIE